MLRPILLAFAAFTTLSACQVEQQVQTTTPEERMALSAEVLAECARTECGRLDLDSRLVADYSAAASMDHVRAFMASWSNFNNADLDKIAPMDQLRELHVGSTQLTDVSGLSQFPNLTLLHLQWVEVDDLSPIARLSNLQELAIGGNDVGHLTFVRGLRNLKALNLDNATIDSFDGLRGHPSLTSIDLIDANLPRDLSALRTIPNLTTLSISSWNLDDSQRALLDQLEADGVIVTREAAVIVC